VDYFGRPLGELLRGPVLHTPQGIVLVGASVCYVLLGLALLAFGDALGALGKKQLWLGCFVMPLLLFLFFVRNNAPGFEPSVKNAIWGVVLAGFPLAYVWLRMS
jgi:hypothetical protein